MPASRFFILERHFEVANRTLAADAETRLPRSIAFSAEKWARPRPTNRDCRPRLSAALAAGESFDPLCDRANCPAGVRWTRRATLCFSVSVGIMIKRPLGSTRSLRRSIRTMA